MNDPHPLLRLRLVTSLAATVALLTACSQPPAANQDIAQNADQSVGCKTFQESFWNDLEQIAYHGQNFVSPSEMALTFNHTFQNGRLASLGESDRARVTDDVVEIYRTLTLEAPLALHVDPNSPHDMLSMLAALEIGDQSTPAHVALQSKIRDSFARIEAADPVSLPACKDKDQSSKAKALALNPQTQFGNWKATRHPAVYGGLKALATAYQSCDVGNSMPLDHTIGDVQGIKITGDAADHIGSLRVISDLPALISTHPYLSHYTKPKASCFDVLKSPLIYDYGGRPLVTSNGTYDFFKDSGGTSVLGTDCSGFVYMAFTTAGLRIKRDVQTKAMTIYGITSHHFFDPKNNGLSCFDYVKFKGKDTIRPGDVLAKLGHVILIDTVGPDPFGVSGITRIEDCRIENMSSSRFDFTVLQSSPSKNGIGIHKAKVADWIPESPIMLQGLLEHAVTACKAKFGKTIKTNSTSAQLIRHLGTPSCIDSGLKMERESCVSSCPVNP